MNSASPHKSRPTPAILVAVMSCFILAGCQTLPFGSPNGQDTATPTATKEAIPAEGEKAGEAASDAAEKQAAEDALQNGEFEYGPVTQQPLLSLRPPAEAEAVRIAILLPLSGPHQGIGDSMLKAAYMALFDQGNKSLKLLPYDTKGTPDGATEAALQATGEGAEVILGPLFASSVDAVRPVAASNNINVIAFSTDTRVAGNGVYLMGLTVGQQIDRVMEFAYRNGLTRFSVLAPESPFGSTVVENVEAAALKYRVEVGKVRSYPTDLPPGAPELHDIAKEIANYDSRRWLLKQEIAKLEKQTSAASQSRLKLLKKMDTYGEVNFDALILPEGGARLRELAPLLSYYDIDPTKVQFIGTGLWADRSLTTEPALVGGWFAAPDPENAQAFQSRFQSLYGYVPPRISSLGYDATALAGLLAREPAIEAAPSPEQPDTADTATKTDALGAPVPADTGLTDAPVASTPVQNIPLKPTKFSAAAIENPAGFSGYDGLFRFSATGVAERSFAIMRVGTNRLELLEPAPTSFEPLLN
ncbi:penicillin-binding protein activator [Sneathiella chinensis]|nr:penicillin-binding protein activator [Sneathiella chinensis]